MFHTYNRLIFWMSVLILILPVIAPAETQSQNAETENSQSTQQAQEVQLHGSVVCLAEEMHTFYHADLPSEHQHLYGFKTEAGTFYTLLRTALSEALFVDKRLHEKSLIIKGRTFPKTQILEAISLRSVHNGVVYDLYYYCETCAIRAVSPGNCVCCGEPVELVEKPTNLQMSK